MAKLSIVCDVDGCHEKTEWDPEESIEYKECPEWWGNLTLSDSQGELQTHYVCPKHLPQAWAALI